MLTGRGTRYTGAAGGRGTLEQVAAQERHRRVHVAAQRERVRDELELVGAVDQAEPEQLSAVGARRRPRHQRRAQLGARRTGHADGVGVRRHVSSVAIGRVVRQHHDDIKRVVTVARRIQDGRDDRLQPRFQVRHISAIPHPVYGVFRRRCVSQWGHYPRGPPNLEHGDPDRPLPREPVRHFLHVLLHELPVAVGPVAGVT